MTTAKAQELVGVLTEGEGNTVLPKLSVWAVWLGHGHDEIALDGVFTAEQLEAIACQLRATGTTPCR